MCHPHADGGSSAQGLRGGCGCSWLCHGWNPCLPLSLYFVGHCPASFTSGYKVHGSVSGKGPPQIPGFMADYYLWGHATQGLSLCKNGVRVSQERGQCEGDGGRRGRREKFPVLARSICLPAVPSHSELSTSAVTSISRVCTIPGRSWGC